LDYKRIGVIFSLFLVLAIPPVSSRENGTLAWEEMMPTQIKAIDDAWDLHKKGIDKYNRKAWKAAKKRFDQALLTLLNMPFEKLVDKKLQDSYGQLFSQICLFQVRLGKMLFNIPYSIEYPKSDFPIIYNERVEKWSMYYMTTGRVYFARWLHRSGKYVEEVKRIFREEELPEEMAYMALVESGFNPNAISPKRAVGLWQFIVTTGKKRELEHNYWVDERKDPFKSTRAAAHHLKDLYNKFGSWECAMAAYNCGEMRLFKEIDRQKTRDFWALRLPLETEAFVPKIMVAILVAREPEIYGFSPEIDLPLEYDDVTVNGAIDLKRVADWCGVTLKEIKDLNPELRRNCTPPGLDDYVLRIPKDTEEKFLNRFTSLTDEIKYLSKKDIDKIKNKGLYVVYRVKTGDSLSVIARRFRTSVARIKKNNLSARGRYIHPGQKLRIYR